MIKTKDIEVLSVTVGRLGHRGNTINLQPPSLSHDESSFVRKILIMIDSRNSFWSFGFKKTYIGCTERQSLMLLAGEKNWLQKYNCIICVTVP